jgi:hypothetical protein
MLTITDNMESYMTTEEEQAYFTYFKKELCPNKENQSISEIAKNGYRAGTAKPNDLHEIAPYAFKKPSKQLEKAMTSKKRLNDYNSYHRHKRCIVLSGRVHPGESNSSYCIQGTIEFILSNTKEAKFLRNYFIFKIVPMLNPDGVAVGNYR